MSKMLKLPIGIENFQEMRQSGFYYVDKTKLIEQLLERWGKVNLFTRPRRFGKTLNMSMTEYFFSVKYSDMGKYFDGLIGMMRKCVSMFNSTFKTNPYLERGLLTGITRVSICSIGECTSSD